MNHRAPAREGGDKANRHHQHDQRIEIQYHVIRQDARQRVGQRIHQREDQRCGGHGQTDIGSAALVGILLPLLLRDVEVSEADQRAQDEQAAEAAYHHMAGSQRGAGHEYVLSLHEFIEKGGRPCGAIVLFAKKDAADCPGGVPACETDCRPCDCPDESV